MSIVGVHRCYKDVLKICIIQLVIELQICISSYEYTSLKIQLNIAQSTGAVEHTDCFSA